MPRVAARGGAAKKAKVAKGMAQGPPAVDAKGVTFTSFKQAYTIGERFASGGFGHIHYGKEKATQDRQTDQTIQQEARKNSKKRATRRERKITDVLNESKGQKAETARRLEVDKPDCREEKGKLETSNAH